VYPLAKCRIKQDPVTSCQCQLTSTRPKSETDTDNKEIAVTCLGVLLCHKYNISERMFTFPVYCLTK